MQPPEHEPPQIDDIDPQMCLATARYWYDYLKAGNTTAPENAEESMRDCMTLVGVNLKKLLNSDKNNEELEKDLRQCVQGIQRKKAKECFDNIIKGELAQPEVFEKKMREYMQSAHVKNLKELVGGDATNEKLEADIRDKIQPHIPRINLDKARVLYGRILEKENDTGDLKQMLEKIETHLKVAQDAAGPTKPQLIDNSAKPESNEALLAPYKSAGGNLNLGHARQIYKELLNGKVEAKLVEERIQDMIIFLKYAKLVDSKLEPMLDPKGVKSNDEMIDVIYERNNPAAKVPAANYRMSDFAKPYDTFRAALEKGKEKEAKEALQKMKEDFIAKYPREDKAREFKRMLGILRERYEDTANPEKSLKGEKFETLKAQVDELEKETGKSLGKPPEKTPAPSVPKSKDGEEMGIHLNLPEDVKKLALAAMGDHSKLDIPRLAVERKTALKR